MKSCFLFCPLVVLFVVLLGCSANSNRQQFIKNDLYYDEYFPQYQAISIESEADVFAIDDEMKEMVRTKLLTEKDLKYRAKKLLHHLFDQEYVNLAYQSDANLTAIEAYHSQTANCMSLTIMAYVLAQEAGLDVEFQNIKVPEFWVRNRQYNMVTGHVNLLVKIPAESSASIIWNNTLVIDFDPFAVKNYFHKKEVEKPTISAMFYANKGAEIMIEGDYEKAYAYLKQATLVSPSYPAGWSNLAILYRMVDNYPLAEKAYRYALNLAPDNLTIQNNLAMLMKKKGAVEEANLLERKIHNQRLDNPYYHGRLGDEALYKGDVNAAKMHFKNAIRLNENIHGFYYGLAKAYYQLDEYDKARNTLKRAIKLNKARTTEHQYIAKLNWMRSSELSE